MFQREEVEVSLPDVYARIGLGTMTWSPLACGILTGKYEDGIPTHSRAALKVKDEAGNIFLAHQTNQSVEIYANQFSFSYYAFLGLWLAQRQDNE